MDRGTEHVSVRGRGACGRSRCPGHPPTTYAAPFPDLLTFHDPPTPIEQRLFVMLLEHRTRTFQGSFHNSPDYALWYG